MRRRTKRYFQTESVRWKYLETDWSCQQYEIHLLMHTLQRTC